MSSGFDRLGKEPSSFGIVGEEQIKSVPVAKKRSTPPSVLLQPISPLTMQRMRTENSEDVNSSSDVNPSTNHDSSIDSNVGSLFI